MIMSVMCVRKVWVDMSQWFVPMLVLGARSDRFSVFMLMVLVVNMLVLMFQRLVLVLMLVALVQVQPDANGH